ncbi:hypothetical protein AB0Q95_43265 [Streptomyces sp. NPDC059900]
MELTESYRRKGENAPNTSTTLLDIRVAELVHVRELIPADPAKKGRFGR